jgi:glycosyltransferase involved in cell wall biosynthesis
VRGYDEVLAKGYQTRIVLSYPRAVVGDGGLSLATRRLAREIADSGQSVLVAFDEGDAPVDTNDLQWVRVRDLGAGRVRVPIGLDHVLTTGDLLLLKSAWVAHNSFAGRVARRTGVPYVLAPRGAYDPYILQRRACTKQIWWRAFEKGLLERARAVHVFFESQRRDIESLGYRGPLVVAPNGVDRPKVTWDGGSGGYLLWIGRFDYEHKGLDLLLQAMKLIPRNERMPLRLHGPDWRDRKRVVIGLIRDLELDDSVVVGEAVFGEQKSALLRSAAGFVYPSRWEAFGNSPAEAIAMGVPTLMTPYPLARSVAERGGAILVDPTPAALADGLRRLGSAEAGAVGREGSRIIQEEFDWPTVARSWTAQLEALM